MLPNEQKFGFDCHRSEWIIHELMKELTETMNGEDIDISKLVLNRDGEYSENLLQTFLDNVIYYAPENCTNEERDYLKSLLYLSIRATSANLQCILNRPEDDEWSDLNVIKSDAFIDKDSTFKNIKQSIGKHVFFACQTAKDAFYASRLGYESVGPVTESLALSVTTLYTLLTNQIVDFPNPYETPSARALRTYESYENANLAIDKAEKEFENNYHDSFYNEFATYPNDSDRVLSEEEQELAKERSEKINLLMRVQTLTPKEVTDKDEALKERLQEIIYSIDDPLFKEEQLRIELVFSHKKEFINTFKHLIQITKPEFAGLENHIAEMLFFYQKSHGLTLYSNPDIFAKVFVNVNEAIEAIRDSRV